MAKLDKQMPMRIRVDVANSSKNTIECYVYAIQCFRVSGSDLWIFRFPKNNAEATNNFPTNTFSHTVTAALWPTIL